MSTGRYLRRNARALGGGKHASPFPSRTLQNSSGNMSGGGGGYPISLNTAGGHVSAWSYLPAPGQTQVHCMAAVAVTDETAIMLFRSVRRKNRLRYVIPTAVHLYIRTAVVHFSWLCTTVLVVTVCQSVALAVDLPSMKSHPEVR
eukprot:COSAG01_NODE_1113_length_11650_cov_59.656913_5_plen_145_part_00